MQKQKEHPECRTVRCPTFDPIKDFTMEPTGHYVLIRPNREERLIEFAVVNRQHEIHLILQGSCAQEIYHTLFQIEAERVLEWFREKDHIAYIGKELYKCEQAIQTGCEYIQE